MTLAERPANDPVTGALAVTRAARRLAVPVETDPQRTPLRLPRLGTLRVRQQTTSLGTGFLGSGGTVIAVVLAAFDLARFGAGFATEPDAGLAAMAWLLLALLLVTLSAAARGAGDHLPTPIANAILAGLAVVVGLDISAAWSTGDLGGRLTAAPAAGLVLLAMVGVRPARSVLAAACALGIVLTLAVVVSWSTGGMPPGAVEHAVLTISRAVGAPAIAAVLVATFRRVVSRELERVIVGSTVSAPRFAVGMLASEELARLDFAAEQLLDGVASGRNRLPLNPASAQAAAELATELRLHLIEGRRQTWLYHAISESDLLGRTVTLSDPDSLAGLLDPRQRDGLLQAVWLMLGDSPERSRRSVLRASVQIELGPQSPAGERRAHIPISIHTVGVPKSRVDPAAWDAVRKIGRHTDSSRGGSLAVSIDCVVDLPPAG